MSKGIEKPTFQELLKDLQSIVEIPDRIKVIDIIRLKELSIQLDKMIFEKWKDINNILIANHNHEHPRMRDIEHWKNNLWQYGFSYNSLNNLKEFIQNRIIELQETVNIDNSNQSKNKKEDPPKWFPIGLGFATGEIQEMRKNNISARKIAKKYELDKYHNIISTTIGNTIKDSKNIYSDFKKLQKIHDYCIENDIKICDHFMKAYNIKLKEIN